MSMSIELSDDFTGCWVEVKAGRKRFFPEKNHLTQAARLGLLTRPKLDESLKNTEKEHDNLRVLYRDASGKLGIPPHPDMIPPGCDRIDVSSLNEEDKLMREMHADLKSQMGEDFMTPLLDQVFADENGNTPRDILKSSTAYRTDYGREMCRAMLKTLDEEESRRNNPEIVSYFHTREFDR